MSPRTLIITAGTVVALAAPATAVAKVLPTAHVAKHVKIAKPVRVKEPVLTRHGQPLQRYIYVRVATNPIPPTPSEVCEQENQDLLDHALDPIDCSTVDAQPATSDEPDATSDVSAAATDESQQTAATVSQDSSATDDGTPVDPDSDC
jgi:hypothetical protein